MTVEELIEALRDMPPTSMVWIDTIEFFETPIGVQYDLGITMIACERSEPKE